MSPEVIAGVEAYGNAALDSYQYTLALANAAEKRAVTIRSGSVRGIKLSTGRVTGVLLGESEIACEHLVLAAGPWSREAETWLDLTIPVDPLKGEILHLDLPGPTLEHDFSGGEARFIPNPMDWSGAAPPKNCRGSTGNPANRRGIRFSRVLSS